MKLDPPQTVAAIAAIISREYVGDAGQLVRGINELHRVEDGDLIFVDHPKYYERALRSAATVILIDKRDAERPPGKALIFSTDPFDDFNTLTRRFRPFRALTSDRGERFQCGANTVIQPGVIIGNDVVIGDDCRIHPGVVLYDHTKVGDRVEIHGGSVVGADAFYYQKRNGNLEKMHSFGWVEIQDDVEIGAACTIDRGVSAATVIGTGTKLDNSVHIGHDVIVGKHCLFAAQVAIGGCARIEDDVVLWGQVGVSSNVCIGKGAVVLGQSGVTKSLDGETTYFGTPAGEARKKMQELAQLRKLPRMTKHLPESGV